MSEHSLPVDQTSTAVCLTQLIKGDQGHITGLISSDTPEQLMLRQRLEELGFLPGETLRVVARSFPANDPIAVRIGNSTFALRRHEAEMIYLHRQS